MKAFLMYPDRDFAPPRALPQHEPDLTADLELGPLLAAMSGGDKFLLAIAGKGIHAGLANGAEITYRQHVLADCIAQPGVIRDLYDLAIEAIGAERQVIGAMSGDSPDAVLQRSRELMLLYLASLHRLAEIASGHAARFRSAGFTRFFAMIASELSGDYLAEIQACLDGLAFRHGTLISARLGQGGKGAGYILRQHPPGRRRRGWRRDGYAFTVADQDDAGFRFLSELTSHGVNETANALAQSCDHVRGFFRLLRAELGFYLACLNLRDRLAARGQPVCFPHPAGLGENRFTARGLYDASLALTLDSEVTGHDVAADGRRLIMITGANQGGKSTFLRSVGQAQLLMEAGMFVAAESCTASVCTGIFTHFKREEDATMDKGKLDEELARMGTITRQIRPGGLLLCNESFASTNEREGSQIAREIIRALTEAGVRVVFVTHLYDLAGSCYAANGGTALFLRAQRGPGGQRAFRLTEGEPLPTGYGEDLFQQVFGAHQQGDLSAARRQEALYDAARFR